MSEFWAAVWAEALKARRSKIAWLTALAFLILPVVGGLFMLILKDPENAREMGLISAKSQLVAGSADWPAFFDVLLQANAMGGVILFAFVAAWVFGREYADRTIKDLMAVPAPRSTIVLAKLSLIAAWLGILSLSVYIAGLGIGAAVQIPGWANDLALAGLARFMLIALLNYLLMPLVALFASIGRGYLPALGWAFTSFVLAQIVSILGWGGWLPWSVPVLWSGMFGAAGAAQVGAHSFLLVFIAFLIGVAATALWWQMADQASQ